MKYSKTLNRTILELKYDGKDNDGDGKIDS